MPAQARRCGADAHNLTYHAWAEAPRTVERFGAYRNEQYTVMLGGEASRHDGARLTPSLFPLLGETPALGRFFAADEGDAAVIVLSHRGWRERFNSDPTIVGRGATIDGKPSTIVGVHCRRISGSLRTGLSSLDAARHDPEALDLTTLVVCTRYARCTGAVS